MLGSTSDRLIGMLERYAALDGADHAALRALPITVRELPAASYVLREGQQPKSCALLLEGFAFRQKLAVDGQRALLSLQVPGDMLDLQNPFLEEADHDVQTLTHAVVAEIAVAEFRELVEARPNINRALWRAGLVEASILREWLLNVGRRDARTRTAHLLCEISARLEAAGLARELTYDLPMTQEQLGDAVGLTSVHVNRVLRALERDGLIRRRKREVSIACWKQLRRAADFNERYLHLRSETV